MDVRTLKDMHSWAEWRMVSKGYDLICMNVRTWRYRWAVKAAQVAKSANPAVQIWAGGMHVTVARDEMIEAGVFDVLWQGEAETGFVDVLKQGPVEKPIISPSTFIGEVPDLDSLPFINRSIWPIAPGNEAQSTWPLEGPCGWGPGPKVATIITSRLCPFKCAFCYPSEKLHFRQYRRRSVAHVMEELKYIDRTWGPINSVVIHDSEFFIDRRWLEEFLAEYPKAGNWPYWAAARADVVCKWPELFEALVRDTNWRTVSIGFESGSDNVLKILNKGCTRAQNDGAIELVNRIGDQLEAEGRVALAMFANIMLAIPGETQEDAFETLRMVAQVKRSIPSMAFFTPYPGSVMGNRLIAEGKSLDRGKDYMRFPDKPKVEGVDYDFYRELLGGRYDHELGFSARRMVMAQGYSGLPS